LTESSIEKRLEVTPTLAEISFAKEKNQPELFLLPDIWIGAMGEKAAAPMRFVGSVHPAHPAKNVNE
jgi:hypothetical protein